MSLQQWVFLCSAAAALILFGVAVAVGLYGKTDLAWVLIVVAAITTFGGHFLGRVFGD